MTPLAEQVDWYLKLLAARPASPGTIANYRSMLARLQRFAAAHGIDDARDITADALDLAVLPRRLVTRSLRSAPGGAA